MVQSKISWNWENRPFSTEVQRPAPLNHSLINDSFQNVPIDLFGAHDYVTELVAVSYVAHGRQFSFILVPEDDVVWDAMRFGSNAVGADMFIKDTNQFTIYTLLSFSNDLIFFFFPYSLEIFCSTSTA